MLCCGYTLTDFPISIRLTSLALWQSNDCPSASKATLMNMDKYFMWIHYERLHNHNKARHNKTVCIFLGIYCIWPRSLCLSVTVPTHQKSCINALSQQQFHHILWTLYIFIFHICNIYPISFQTVPTLRILYSKWSTLTAEAPKSPF